MGVSGYLPKPFPLATFMDTVERTIRTAPTAPGEP